MEVTSCESQADAVQHLGSCHWNLDEAINLYFSNASGSTEPPPGSSADPILPEENATEPPSGSSADPIILPEEHVPTKEDKDHGDAIDGDYEDDVRAPQYYGDRSTAVDAPFVMEVPSLSLSEIVPTGWGEPGVENVDDGNQQQAHDDDAEQDDNISTKEDDGGSMHSSNGEEYNDEDYSNMSYSEEEDDDDAYYASLAEETDGDRPEVQPQPKESLLELFRHPYELMYRGSFHDAKVNAARGDRFLLVNLQTSTGAGDFPSKMQNRDLWADELVKKVVEDSFVFFLLQTLNSDAHLDECAKLASFYKLEKDQLPAVLVLDPITGQLLAKRSGAMMPDEFMKFVDEYMKSKPSAISVPKFVEKRPVFPAPVAVDAGGEQELAWGSAAGAVEQEPPAVSESPAAPADDEVGEQEQEIPNNSAAAGGACSEQEPVPVPNNTTELPAEMVDAADDEPMEDEEMYKLRIRFPDGTMVAKEFGCKRRVASLFAFCRSALHGGGQHAEEKKAIRIMRFAGRALVAIQDDDAGATFEDLGLNFAAVSVVFDV
ncbi:putative plant UBX domain-containing protein 14 [Miscanthus floridulus]|uniref:putative plant UBX domain-containing protein 14 n=1 Tax=Miscanthus floridulus TaxID=154761 RepID=UPI003458B3DA